MADSVKISALPTATTVSGADTIPIVQNGVTKQIAESNFNSAASILAKLLTVDGPSSGIDVASVSGFGIGVECANVLTTFSQVLKGGKYVADSISGLPEDGYYTLDVIVSPVFDAIWAFNISNAKLFVGARSHGTGAILWRQIFNSSVGSTTGTDGNGGQPPAPKPTTGTPAGGANGPGQFRNGSIASGGTIYFSGDVNLSGTWFIWIWSYNGTSIDGSRCTGSLGGGVWATVNAGCTTNFAAWRIA